MTSYAPALLSFVGILRHNTQTNKFLTSWNFANAFAQTTTPAGAGSNALVVTAPDGGAGGISSLTVRLYRASAATGPALSDLSANVQDCGGS